MSLILVSQRIDYLTDRDEFRESIDPRLIMMLQACSLVPISVSNYLDKNTLYKLVNSADGFLLSGGNNIGEYVKRDDTESFMLDHSIQSHKPVLGICRGMQMMLTHQNTQISQIPGHVNSSHEIDYGSHSIKVNSFHNYGALLENLPSSFMCLAHSSDYVVEHVCHSIHNWTGIMWHPERNQLFSSDDLDLVRSTFD